LKVISLLQAFPSAIFRICGALRSPSASTELLVPFYYPRSFEYNLTTVASGVSACRYDCTTWCVLAAGGGGVARLDVDTFKPLVLVRRHSDAVLRCRFTDAVNTEWRVDGRRIASTSTKSVPPLLSTSLSRSRNILPTTLAGKIKQSVGFGSATARDHAL